MTSVFFGLEKAKQRKNMDKHFTIQLESIAIVDIFRLVLKKYNIKLKGYAKRNKKRRRRDLNPRISKYR